MAATKKPTTRKRSTTAKKSTRSVAAVSRKQAQEQLESNRIFGLSLLFTILSLIFLLFAMIRYA